MSKEAPMYVYATEMVASHYSLLKIKGATVLTICGSGDQVLNAHFLGAAKVIGFDINERAEFMTSLKLAAIKELNYDEFLSFFGSPLESKLLNYPVYLRIRRALDKRTSHFFDRLYKKFQFDGKKLASSDNFRRRGNSIKRTKLINLYLRNEKAYLKMKELLNTFQFEFIRCKVEDLAFSKKLKNKFDIINLSNTPDYITMNFQKKGTKDPFKLFIHNTVLPLFKLISEKGLICYYYHSSEVYRSETLPPAAKKSEITRPEFKKDLKIIQKKIKGVFDRTLDNVVIFKTKS